MITLISPYTDITAYPVRILSGFLKSKGIKTRIIFTPNFEYYSFKLTPSPQEIYSERMISQLVELCSDSSLIGFSFFTRDFYNVVYLTERLKKSLENPIVWGGKHVSAKPEQAIQYADIICIGEGEEALYELAEKVENKDNYSGIKNLWTKCNGEIIKNPVRKLIENLDLIPLPDYSFEEHYVYNMRDDRIDPLTPETIGKYIPPESPTGMLSYGTLFSRGCPFNCTYCFSFKKMYTGQKYLRFRSIENLIHELELMKRKLAFIQMISLIDDNIFTLDEDTIREFCKAYKERIDLPLSFVGYPTDITAEKLSHLVDAGLIRTHIGVQTGSARTRRLYKRNIPNEAILNAAFALNKFKDRILPSYDVIIDNPYENDEDLVETIKLLIKIPKPRDFSIFSLTFFPGTELYNKAKLDSILSDNDEPNEYNKSYNSFYYRKKKYLNFVLLLVRKGIPGFIINILINKYVIFLLDRSIINNLLANIVSLMKSTRKTKKI